MAEWVALASVVSSAAVALGGLGVSYWSGREQRAHERGLSFEERSWETKSKGLFGVIAITRALIDDMPDSRSFDRGQLAVNTVTIQERLWHLVPVVETYGSVECRKAFDELRGLLAESGVDPLVATSIAACRKEKEDAIDAGDFDAAVVVMHREGAVFAQAADMLQLDLGKTREVATGLLAAARRSLRGE